MRIASYQLDGRNYVGMVSADGTQVTPLDLSEEQAAKGALPIVEFLSAGKPLPSPAGASMPINTVRLYAPMPIPRRNLWCVGRNYHAHAKELQTSVFKDNDANPESCPIVFTKVPECVVGPYDDVKMPGAEVSEQIDYRCTCWRGAGHETASLPEGW